MCVVMAATAAGTPTTAAEAGALRRALPLGRWPVRGNGNGCSYGGRGSRRCRGHPS